MKEYRVVYDHNGFTIEAGQNRWIPSKEIAEKILKHHQSRQYFKDTKLYLEEREIENPRQRTACKMYKDKIVYNEDWFYIDAWETDDDNEEGKVIALINIKTKEVGYAVNSARLDDYAQEIINETLSNIDNGDYKGC